jgi:ABC-type dipeptide/oligopeptide/nickel transport system ATPase component
MSMVMITHDMGIIADMTERVTIMYAGRVMEAADTKSIFHEPKHPYTEALLAAVPRVDQRRLLEVIPGNIPNIVAAGRLKINMKEWAVIGVPIGLAIMIIYFVVLIPPLF